MMQFDELKSFLDLKANQYETSNFIQDDPIQIPHRFHKKEDIEISAFLISIIAWGNRKAIIKSGEKLIQLLNESPYEFVINYKGSPLPFVHRTFNQEDLQFFIRSLQNIYLNHGGLESAFALRAGQQGIKQRIINFRELFLSIPHDKRSEKHLSNPAKGSSAKRINMFLRWMVRSEGMGVDFGIWKSISPAELYLPLDVHTGNVSRKLGLLTRKQDDWKALDELMSHLIKMDAKDPVKYDFALFGIGVYNEL